MPIESAIAEEIRAIEDRKFHEDLNRAIEKEKMMIVEPRDTLFVLMGSPLPLGSEGGSLQHRLAQELRRVTSSHFEIDPKDIEIWAPDWFCEMYTTLSRACDRAEGAVRKPPTLLLGAVLRKNSEHPEWGAADDDRRRRFHVCTRNGWAPTY